MATRRRRRKVFQIRIIKSVRGNNFVGQFSKVGKFPFDRDLFANRRAAEERKRVLEQFNRDSIRGGFPKQFDRLIIEEILV